MKDVIYGLIGGAIGALVWAGVVHVSGYEIGWVAWGIGGLVGFCVALGNEDRGRAPTIAGALAVGITILSIVAGKYAAVELLIPDDAELIALFTEDFEKEEFVISFVADEVASEFEAAGRPVAWPDGVDPANAATEAEYPPDVWEEAALRWSQLTDSEKISFREAREAETRENIRTNLPEIRALMSRGGFLGSFAPMDLIFFGLGMVTAFGVASGRKSEAAVATAHQEAILLAMLRVMLADGEIEESEVEVIASVYQEMTGAEISEDALRAEAAAALSGSRKLLVALAELSPNLDNQQREAVVQAAIKVAVADGSVGAEEVHLIGRIAHAVGVSEAHLRGIFAEFVEVPAS